MAPQPANQDGRILYVIVNSIPPYEVNSILALPNGMSYCARFRQDCVPEISNPKDIEFSDGIIVLRDWEKAILIPLRRIKTAGIESVGDIYYINSILLDLVEYDSDESHRLNQVKEFNEKAAIELSQYPNEPGKDLKKLVFLAPDITTGIWNSHRRGTSSNIEYDDWGKIVTLVSDMQCFFDIDFLKFIQLTNSQRKTQKIIRSSTEAVYILENGSTYYLDVLQRSFSLKMDNVSISERSIVLSADSEAIKPLKNKFTIAGRYDRYRFTFKAQAQQKDRNTHIAVDIIRSDEKGPIPTIYIPLQIRTPIVSLLLQVTALLSFVAGTILLFLSDSLVPANPELAKNIGILAMIISGGETRELIISLLARIGQIFSTK